jgi:hypothetical protein
MSKKRFVIPIQFNALTITAGDGFSISTTYAGGVPGIVAQDILFSANITNDSLAVVAVELQARIRAATGASGTEQVLRYWQDGFYLFDTDLESITFGPPSSGADLTAKLGFTTGTTFATNNIVEGDMIYGPWRYGETITLVPIQHARARIVNLNEFKKPVLVVKCVAESLHNDTPSLVLKWAMTNDIVAIRYPPNTLVGLSGLGAVLEDMYPPTTHGTTTYSWIPLLPKTVLHGSCPIQNVLFRFSNRDNNIGFANRNVTYSAWLSVER